ncbi:MAG: hypothetical protein Q4A07_07165 [Coriobacteriales bacterium]|nr:hypothetical protein [Coriobacteriales bacterium]
MLVKKKLLSVVAATFAAFALLPICGAAYAEEAIVVEDDPIVVESATDDEAVIIQEDGHWTPELYARAVYNTGKSDVMTLNDGDELHLHPNQKACIAFITNGEDNLQHGYAPFVGWHDTITDEAGNIIKEKGDLSKLGFEVRSGTLAELGYSGQLTDAQGVNLPDSTLAIEVGTGNLTAGKGGWLQYYPYFYSGSDSDLTPIPAEKALWNRLFVMVTKTTTTTTPATLTDDGSIVTTCDVCGEVFSNKTISHPDKIALKNKTYTYNGTKREPKFTVKDANGATIATSNYTVTYSKNKNAGTAKAKITFKNNYSGSKTLSFKINKAANPLKVSARMATVEYSKVKSANQKLAVSKVLSFAKKGQGTMSYTKVSGSKKITINKSTGKVAIKKGLKKGTYEVTVKVKAAGNTNYKASAVKKVTFWIRIQ